jgi:hypothetical protein
MPDGEAADGLVRRTIRIDRRFNKRVFDLFLIAFSAVTTSVFIKVYYDNRKKPSVLKINRGLSFRYDRLRKIYVPDVSGNVPLRCR